MANCGVVDLKNENIRLQVFCKTKKFKKQGGRMV